MNEHAIIIDINIFQLWILAKIVIAGSLVWWEACYHTYKTQQLIKRFITQFIFTEWTIFKVMLGCIGWVLGKGYPACLYPIYKPNTSSCKSCNSTGIIKQKWNDKGRPCACVLIKQWNSQFKKDQQDWNNKC